MKKNPTICIVNDSMNKRSSVVSGDIQSRYPEVKIVEYLDPNSAVEGIKNYAPKLILLDLESQSFDSAKFMKIMSEKRLFMGTTAILIVEQALSPEKEMLLSTLGVDRFFVRPLVIDELMSYIEKVMNE